MIEVRLAGGLGNQLFQLAAALALRSSECEPVVLHVDGLSRYRQPRAPDIARLMNLASLSVALGSQRSFISTALYEKMRLARTLPWLGVSDRRFSAALKQRSHFPHRSHTFLDGYFQLGWTWSALSKALIQMINALSSAEPQQPRAGFGTLHVRGGDFLRSPIHQVVQADYYLRAISTARDRETLQHITVVTDDEPFARAFLAELPLKHPTIEIAYKPAADDPLNDFHMLRASGCRVIGNSTFSWWASAMDTNRALTISPDQFVRDQPRHLLLPWEISLPATASDKRDSSSHSIDNTTNPNS